MAKNKEEKELNGAEESNPQEGTPATMEVPVDKIDEILKRVDSLESANKELARSNEALRSVVSSTRLQEEEDKQGKDERPRVHFRLLDGKAVVGWPESIGPEKKNELIFNPSTNSPVGEILKSVYYFADGTKSELIDQIRFTRSTDVAYARVVEDDGDYGIMEFEDKGIFPEQVRVHKRFWNA